MATHDQSSAEFKELVDVYMQFFTSITPRQVAEFCVHINATVEGLQKNNEMLAKAYRDALSAAQLRVNHDSAAHCACGVPVDDCIIHARMYPED